MSENAGEALEVRRLVKHCEPFVLEPLGLDLEAGAARRGSGGFHGGARPEPCFCTAPARVDIERLEPGQEAPDFEAPIQDGRTLRLSDYRGQWVALYFYPKDDTPGCTKQACNLRDGEQTLQDAGIAVIGVSEDDVDAHAQFAEKYDLPFPLVADPEHDILNAYGVYGERQMYGNTFMGTTRTTYLIDPDGIIRYVFKRPKTDAHTEEILKKFESVAA